MTRSPDIQRFLDASATALLAATSGEAARASKHAVDLWTAKAGSAGSAFAARLPVCDWIAEIGSAALAGPRQDLARAFLAIEPKLHWYRRSSARPENAAFWNGHANAMILGPGGLEERSDIWVGATVMAPGVTYVDHDHPPEEVYLSLAPGEWWNAAMDWTDPGPTGAIYNPPGILHRMRSGAGPFLALWYLPV